MLVVVVEVALIKALIVEVFDLSEEGVYGDEVEEGEGERESEGDDVITTTLDGVTRFVMVGGSVVLLAVLCCCCCCWSVTSPFNSAVTVVVLADDDEEGTSLLVMTSSLPPPPPPEPSFVGT